MLLHHAAFLGWAVVCSMVSLILWSKNEKERNLMFPATHLTFLVLKKKLYLKPEPRAAIATSQPTEAH